MQYLSAIAVFQHAGVDIATRDSGILLKAQKRLLAEIDMSETAMIEIDGIPVSKDDILSLFDELKHEQAWVFHQWIFDNHGLYQFLMHDAITDGSISIEKNILLHSAFPDFKSFVSPFLVPLMSRVLHQLYLRREFNDAAKVLKLEQLIDDGHFDSCFSKLKHELQLLVSEIKDLEHGRLHFEARRLNLINDGFIAFLNALPESLHSIRDDIGAALVNLTVAVRDRFPHFCYEIYKPLRYLRCSDELARLIAGNFRISEADYGHKQGKPSPVAVYLPIALFTIVLLSGLRNCDKPTTQNNIALSLREQNVIMKTAFIQEEVRMKKKLYDMTTRQLDPRLADSLKVMWSSRSLFVHPKPWPHWPAYDSLYFTDANVTIQNKSVYDLALFVHREWRGRSTLLSRGESISVRLDDGDYISVYAGRDWDPGKWVPNAKNGEAVYGLFSRVDSASLWSTTRLWRFQCQHDSCASSVVEFQSPGKKGILLKADDKFKMETTMEILPF